MGTKQVCIVLGVYYSKDKFNAPRLPASLLGGDNKRRGQAQGERRALRCCQRMVRRRLTNYLTCRYGARGIAVKYSALL